MKHKITLFDLALWAALPMAHTSRIEGRIGLILDSTRRRTLSRRALVFGIALGAATLVPLAMLRPVAEAQSTPASAQAQPRGNAPVQILGVTDAAQPGEMWWSESGKALSMPVYDMSQWGIRAETTVKSGQKALFIAFYLPKPLQNVPVIYDVGGTTLDGITRTTLDGRYTKTMRSLQMQASKSLLLYGAAFPLSLSKTDVQVGAATDFGEETVNCPKTAGKTRFQRPSGEVIFTLIPPHGLTSVEDVYGSRGLTPPKSASGNAVLIVSDHFHSPSPLKVDKITVMISSYASRTRSGDAVQRILHDGENEERTVYGLDKSGRIIAKLAGTYDPSLEEEADDRFKMEQLISIPKSLLKRIASFRLVVRPYQWTEFKNVALQPVRAESATAAPAPVPDLTPWNSMDNYEDWKVARTYRLSERIQPSVSGTRPEPPVGGRLASGPGRVANFVIKPWKPGKSNILTVQYDYTPKITDKVHPDVIELLTKNGTVASVITQKSHQQKPGEL